MFRLPPYKVESVYVALSETVDWGLSLLGIPELWKETVGAGIIVAVLDTGVELDHRDLRGAILDAQDFTRSPAGVRDELGHGCHCCGIIGARQNGTGIIGVAPACSLLVGKVLDSGAGNERGIIAGLEWAVDRGADIVSISFGSNSASAEMRQAVQRAASKSVLVCAAGNDGPAANSIDYPAKYEEVIAVGAVDRRQKLVDSSSRGEELDILAPGEDILSCYLLNSYARLSGTSMAAPFVAGVVALYMAHFCDQNGRKPTRAEVVDALLRTASKQIGDRQDVGFGLIDPRAFV